MCVREFLEAAVAGEVAPSGLDGPFRRTPRHPARGETAAQWISNFKPLTRLPNRALFEREADDLASCVRDAGGEAVVLAFDLDRFQLVNESFGHEAGNALLRLVGSRLVDAVKPGEVAARSCADGFMVLASVSSDAELGALVDRYRSVFHAPFLLGSESLHVDATFGVGRYPRDADDARGLVHAALTALHRARRMLTTVCFFEPSMRKEAAGRMTLARDVSSSGYPEYSPDPC